MSEVLPLKCFLWISIFLALSQLTVQLSLITNMCPFQAVFDQSKGYVVQSLVNVSHRLTKLSTNLSQLLNAHNGRLEHINHQLHCIQQVLYHVFHFQISHVFYWCCIVVLYLLFNSYLPRKTYAYVMYYTVKPRLTGVPGERKIPR